MYQAKSKTQAKEQAEVKRLEENEVNYFRVHQIGLVLRI
jgi:hypothetical protein